MNVTDFKILKEILPDNQFYDIEFTINNLHKFGSTLPVEFFQDYFLPKLYEMINFQNQKEIQIDFDESIGMVYLKKYENNLIFYLRSYRMYEGYQINEVSDMTIFFSFNENVRIGIENFLIENNYISFTQNKRRRID
jgi:hypothetical protein